MYQITNRSIDVFVNADVFRIVEIIGLEKAANFLHCALLTFFQRNFIKFCEVALQI